jgi:hypothetical protein
MNKGIMAILVLAGVLSCTSVPTQPPAEGNSVYSLARCYGVSKESVEAVAHAFGVDPSDLARYGDQPFPLNYIQYTLGWSPHQSNHQKIYRYEVDALMTGYVSKCDLADTVTLYLFYSGRLRPKTLFQGEALPLEVLYELDTTQDGIRDDQVVQSFTFYELSDSGGWPWEEVAPHCDPSAKY